MNAFNVSNLRLSRLKFRARSSLDADRTGTLFSLSMFGTFSNSLWLSEGDVEHVRLGNFERYS